MGLEADCTASWGQETSKGRAQLETDAVRFKGSFRLVIPRRDIRKVVARDGRLEIAFGRDRAVLDLGAQAERWADKIQNPPSVLDKLGVKPGLKVSVVGAADEALVALLHARTGAFAVPRTSCSSSRPRRATSRGWRWCARRSCPRGPSGSSGPKAGRS